MCDSLQCWSHLIIKKVNFLLQDLQWIIYPVLYLKSPMFKCSNSVHEQQKVCSSQSIRGKLESVLQMNVRCSDLYVILYNDAVWISSAFHSKKLKLAFKVLMQGNQAFRKNHRGWGWRKCNQGVLCLVHGLDQLAHFAELLVHCRNMFFPK